MMADTAVQGRQRFAAIDAASGGTQAVAQRAVGVELRAPRRRQLHLASGLGLRRPADIGVAVRGGIWGLRLDDQMFDAIGGAAHLATGCVRGDAPRYTLELTGGASALHVETR